MRQIAFKSTEELILCECREVYSECFNEALPAESTMCTGRRG